MEQERKQRDIRRRQEEQRRLARRRQQRKKENNGKRATWILLLMLCLLMIGGIVASAYTFMFPVRQIQVKGNSRYSTEAVVAAAAIPTGSNLLRVNPQTVENRVRSACPYITDVKLQRKLPDRVVITVVEDGPGLAFMTGKEFVLTTDTYEYIETASSAGNATVIYGVSVTPAAAGQPVTFANPQNKTDLDTLLKELTEQSITDITEIDIKDAKHIRLKYKKLHVWEIGELTNLSYKLTFGQQVSKRETQTGTVDLSWLTSNNKDAFFKGGVLEDLAPELPPEAKPEPEVETPAVSIAYEDGFVLLSDELTFIEIAKEAQGGVEVYGVTVTPDAEAKTIAFAYESTKTLLIQIRDELKAAEITDITAMDLNTSNNIRLRYKDLHLWNMGDPSDMTAKLQFAYAISRNRTEIGEIDLARMLEGESAAFTVTDQLTDISQVYEPVYEESNDEESYYAEEDTTAWEDESIDSQW